MSKEAHIRVSISVESIRNSLRKKIVSEHSTLITNVIMNNLQHTERGLEQLYKALSGVEDVLKFKVGDIVMVKTSAMRTWSFDLKETETAGLILQERIKGQITQIKRHKLTPYTITAEVMKSKDNSIKSDHEVSEDDICLAEEWPDKVSDDLPF